MVGRPPPLPPLSAPAAPGSCSSTRWPSHCASTTACRPAPPAPSSPPSSPPAAPGARTSASAGSGASVRRSAPLRTLRAFRPSSLAASSRSCTPTASLADSPSWCASVAGSAATWCSLAIRHSACRAAWFASSGADATPSPRDAVCGPASDARDPFSDMRTSPLPYGYAKPCRPLRASGIRQAPNRRDMTNKSNHCPSANLRECHAKERAKNRHPRTNSIQRKTNKYRRHRSTQFSLVTGMHE
ncbi:hypothetical protein ACAN107058_23300 [Paracidovorax anthurii]